MAKSLFSYVIFEDYFDDITDFRSNDGPQETKMSRFVLFTCKAAACVLFVNRFQISSSNPLVTSGEENGWVAEQIEKNTHKWTDKIRQHGQTLSSDSRKKQLHLHLQMN